MIDIHSHILPGLDDGAQSLEDSLEMAKQAYRDGIDTIIATPHYNSVYKNTANGILQAVKHLNDALYHHDIPVNILPGQEIRIYGQMLSDLNEGKLLALNQTSGYIFVELPHNHVPRYTSQLLFELKMLGYQPIIVHPERNKEIIQNPEVLYKLVQNGALTQVTASSVGGQFGRKIAKFSIKLIKANLAHFMASDAHDTKKRTVHLKESFRIVAKEISNSKRDEMINNSKLLVEGKWVEADEPSPIKPSKIMDLIGFK